MSSLEEHQVINFLVQEFKEPDAFLKKIEELGEDLSAESYDLITCKDGRVFEFYSQPQRLGDKIVGRVWSFRDITKRFKAEADLRKEQEKTESLLLNILPEQIAGKLKENQDTIAEYFAQATVLFADIVGFTNMASTLSPIELVELLNLIFSAFDILTERYELEKIKTIGDAYMVVGGLPQAREDHAIAVAEMALDMLEAITIFNETYEQNFAIRIGIHSGPVVAGVIGIKKFIYDLWGDTVNTASRMESHGLPGFIHVSSDTYELLQERYLWEERGIIPVKGKGEMNTYFLIDRK